MNDKGEIVGATYGTPFGRNAFYWKDGIMTMLPKVVIGPSYATAINKKGQIVGVNDSHLILWNKKEYKGK